ncbi:hypothetical protein [Rhodococcus koreensis]|uniref:hypothetical protein n=1 Tax=Rhodococcus koreensis TaxID=99653 RepID=UPI00366AE5E6
MTNEIEQYNAPAAELVATPVADIAQDLQAHVAALKSADVLAEMIHTSVQAYDGGTDSKGKRRAGQKEAAVAIYHGMQLGWSPLTSLQNIFTVHGVPAMYARAMRALLISKGHEVETVESTTTTATVRARHAGHPNWEEVTWTIELATAAGYTSNPKYKTDPRGMLYAKALADACRRACPDVLMGMAYSAEDLELEQRPVHVESERVQAGPKRGTAALVEKLGVPAGSTPDPILATPADLKKLNDALTKAEITGREQVEAFLRTRTGRPTLASSKEMTRDEVASTIRFIETGEEPAGDPA